MKTLEQVETISDQDRQLLHEVKQIVQKFLPAAEVVLYGSVARGTQDAESDYDILVLTDKSLTTKEEDVVEEALYDLQLAKGVLICTIFYEKEFWRKHPNMPFHRKVDQDAVAL
jgi:predicted nucleotidyltransferase